VASLAHRTAAERYTLEVLTVRRTYLFALALLVAAFVALYPYLDSMQMCDSGECPMAAHSSASVGFSAAGCLIVAVLASVPTMVRALFALRMSGAASEQRPLQVFSSPDPPPPRFFLSR
jgi:hypothetical protein